MRDAAQALTATRRGELVELLCEAAEIEHSLCLQYLYAAFSLKTRTEEGGVDDVELELVREWKGQLLLLAREEMLHLGLVLNLLAAVGGAPYLNRPAFPQPERYYPLGVVSALEPFSRATLARFIRYEMPTTLLKQLNGRPENGRPAMTVGMLYEQIRRAIESVPEADLFIGSPLRQVDTAAVINPDDVFAEDVLTGYHVEPFVIDGRAAATRAIDLIIEQGEGSPAEHEHSHHGRLLAIRDQLDRLAALAEADGRSFAPSRALVCNPAVRPGSGPDEHRITDPVAMQAAELFNTGYRLLVLMLLRFFGRVTESRAESREIQAVAFFPLMTMVIRPLGELLTELPAGRGDLTGRAGPPFEFGRGLALIPERDVARRVFTELLADLAERGHALALAARAAGVADAVCRRFDFLAENMARIHTDFRDTVTQGTSHA